MECCWGKVDEKMKAYHDLEWGVPVHNDRIHFEFLVLESAQAGLSWSTILNRREGYRRVYEDFDPETVAAYNERKIESMLQDSGIIRNRLKIRASINNAARFLEVQKEFGSFSQYLWGFVDHKPVIGGWKTIDQMPATTPLSEQISKDLKKRGFKFVGPTIVYSHLQATGIVMDHLVSCPRYGDLTP